MNFEGLAIAGRVPRGVSVMRRDEIFDASRKSCRLSLFGYYLNTVAQVESKPRCVC